MICHVCCPFTFYFFATSSSFNFRFFFWLSGKLIKRDWRIMQMKLCKSLVQKMHSTSDPVWKQHWSFVEKKFYQTTYYYSFNVWSMDYGECEMWIENNSANRIKTHMAWKLETILFSWIFHISFIYRIQFVCVPFWIIIRLKKMADTTLRDTRYGNNLNNVPVTVKLKDKTKVFFCKIKNAEKKWFLQKW